MPKRVGALATRAGHVVAGAIVLKPRMPSLGTVAQLAQPAWPHPALSASLEETTYASRIPHCPRTLMAAMGGTRAINECVGVHAIAKGRVRVA